MARCQHRGNNDHELTRVNGSSVLHYRKGKPQDEAVQVAEFMREIGLKCIGFNGVCHSPPSFPTLAKQSQ